MKKFFDYGALMDSGGTSASTSHQSVRATATRTNLLNDSCARQGRGSMGIVLG